MADYKSVILVKNIKLFIIHLIVKLVMRQYEIRNLRIMGKINIQKVIQ